MSVKSQIRRNPTRHSRNRQPLSITKGSNIPTSINALPQPYPNVPATGMHGYAHTPDHWAAITATHPIFGEAQWGLKPAGKLTWSAQSSLARDFTWVSSCLRGRVCAYDNPHVIQSCFEVVWDLYTIYANDIKKWDPLKGETIFHKASQLNSQDGFVFEHCIYLQMQEHNNTPPSFEISYTCPFCRRKGTMTLSKSMTLSLGCGLVSRDEWVAATVCQMSGATKCRNSWCIDVSCVDIEEANLANGRGKGCITQGHCVCKPAEEGSYREDCLLARHMMLEEGRAKILQLLKQSNIDPDSKGNYYARIRSYTPRLIFRADSEWSATFDAEVLSSAFRLSKEFSQG